MKFFSSKIVTKPISLEDAIKKAGEQPKFRSLDEIIASAKQIKTASVQAETKTAAVKPKAEAPKVEIKVAGELQKEAITRITDDSTTSFPGHKGLQLSRDFPQTAAEGHDLHQYTTEDEGFRALEHKKQTGKYPGMSEVGENKYKMVDTPKYQDEKRELMNRPYPPPGVTLRKKKPVVPDLSMQRDDPLSQPKSIGPAPVSASGKKQLKMASKVNFTQWEEPKMVVDAWKQHGSIEACVKNVSGNTNDPQTYCALLQVAASEADKMVKAASAKKQTKEASKKAPVAPVYKKIAKLTTKERSFLDEYFTKIYGKDYVDALLGDY